MSIQNFHTLREDLLLQHCMITYNLSSSSYSPHGPFLVLLHHIFVAIFTYNCYWTPFHGPLCSHCYFFLLLDVGLTASSMWLSIQFSLKNIFRLVMTGPHEALSWTPTFSFYYVSISKFLLFIYFKFLGLNFIISLSKCVLLIHFEFPEVVFIKFFYKIILTHSHWIA